MVLRTATTEAVGFSVVLDLAPHRAGGRRWSATSAPTCSAPTGTPTSRWPTCSASPDVPIGDALLDQRNLAGVGNVFKSELCFLGGVDPLTPVAAVPDLPLVVDRAKVLLEANKDRFTRITTGDRRPGYQLWVYGRRGPLPALRHAHRKADQGPPGQERPTYWCPRCQPRGPELATPRSCPCASRRPDRFPA